MRVNNTATAANLQILYKNEMGADVEFVLKSKLENGEKSIPAHKVILAVASPVFQKMFYGDLKEGAVVQIPDESFEAFAEFLQFFYMAEIDLTEGNIYEVFKMLDKYDVQRCQADCENFLFDTVTSEVACLYYDVALTYNYSEDVLEKVEDHICADAVNVLESNSFLKSSRAVLQNILQMDHLNCPEIKVLTAAMSWATVNCANKDLLPSGENLRAELGDCFTLIRFPLLSIDQIIDCDELYRNLFETNEIADILRTIWHPEGSAALLYSQNHESLPYTAEPKFNTKQRNYGDFEIRDRKKYFVTVRR